MNFEKNTVFVILVVTFLAIGAYVFVNLPTGSTSETISVQGISEIITKPDLAVLYLNIETLDESAKKSEQENAEITKDVMDALSDLGFEDTEIETLSYNIYEDYLYESGSRNFKGYKTSHQIKVSIEETDFIGTVIDRVVENGALISSLQFEINNAKEQELKAQALEMATEDAKNKAEAIAKGSGGKLGKVVSISANDYYYRPYLAYESAGVADVAEAKVAATQINTRDITINAQVQAIYKIR
jgi:uncharacterized protein